MPPSLMVIALWGSIGGSTTIIFLAGLQGVPQELHESASIGRGRLGPAVLQDRPAAPLSPTIFVTVVIGLIAALKVFEVAFVATRGGPNFSTGIFILHLYHAAF